MIFRLLPVKLLAAILLFVPFYCWGQIYTEETLFSRLKNDGQLAEELLSKRSVVLHSYTLTPKEITTIHEGLNKTGIDAVAYFPLDGVLAGRDVADSYEGYFAKREITNLVIIQKSSSEFIITITAFNGKSDFVSMGQLSWSTRSSSLNDVLATVYRTALAANKKKNLLINDIPETGLPVKVIDGQRAENFAYDLKVDMLAVPKFNDPGLDTALEQIAKKYPLRYQLVDPAISEKELRNKGFLYVLCFVNTRCNMAKELLGYSVKQSESAFVSVTYPNGQVQLKTIPANMPVFKFYVRHLDSGNVFLGGKWDADTTWQQALLNYIKGFKTELKIE